MKAATQIRTLSVPDPVVDEYQLRAVEQTYLQRYFRAQADIERELATHRPTTPPPTTRMRDLTQE